MNKLTICPWCRNYESERGIRSEKRTNSFGDVDEVWFGECECGARGPHAEDESQAIIEWNKWLLGAWVFFNKKDEKNERTGEQKK
jgi:hypothetical protein